MAATTGSTKPRRGKQLMKGAKIGAEVMGREGFWVSLTGHPACSYSVRLNTKRRSPDETTVAEWVLKTFPGSRLAGRKLVLDAPAVGYVSRPRGDTNHQLIEIKVLRGASTASPNTPLKTVRAAYPEGLSEQFAALTGEFGELNNTIEDSKERIADLEQAQDFLRKEKDTLAAAKRKDETKLQQFQDERLKEPSVVRALLSKYENRGLHDKVRKATQKALKEGLTLESFLDQCFRNWSSAERLLDQQRDENAKHRGRSGTKGSESRPGPEPQQP